MSGLGDVQPKAGVRISLVQASCNASEAEYKVTLSTEGGVSVGQAKVTESGEPEVTLQTKLPDKVVQLVTALLRTSCRGRAAKEWPRRITRWRELPNESTL